MDNITDNTTYSHSDSTDYYFSHTTDHSDNYSEDEYRHQLRKIIRMWLLLVKILPYIEGTFSVIGILGNVMVCIVILCRKSMHTVTKCYVFGLSVSDLLLLIFGTFYDIYYLDRYFGTPIDQTIISMLSEYLMCVSILTVTAFTIERYLAICQPFYSHKNSSANRTVRLLIGLWIMAILIILPSILVFFTEPEGILGMSADMRTRFLFYYYCAYSVIFLFIPVIVITTLYILIGLTILKSKETQRNLTNSRDASQKTGLVMMGIIVIVAVICWSPIFIIDMIVGKIHMDKETKLKLTEKDVLIHYFLEDLSRFLLRLSPVLNPMIYIAMSSQFRRAFKEVITDRFLNLCSCRESSNGSVPMSQQHGLSLNTETTTNETEL